MGSATERKFNVKVSDRDHAWSDYLSASARFCLDVIMDDAPTVLVITAALMNQTTLFTSNDNNSFGYYRNLNSRDIINDSSIY